MVVRENFGAIEAFEKAPDGVRMVFRKDGDWKPLAGPATPPRARGYEPELALLPQRISRRYGRGMTS